MHNCKGIKVKNGYFRDLALCTICFPNYYFKQTLIVFARTKHIRKLRLFTWKNLESHFSLYYVTLKGETVQPMVERTLE